MGHVYCLCVPPTLPNHSSDYVETVNKNYKHSNLGQVRAPVVESALSETCCSVASVLLLYNMNDVGEFA